MSKRAKIIIGNTSKRKVAGGGAWIGQGEVIASYEDAIPVQAVNDLLLNWEPVEVPNANLIPVSLEADRIDTIVDGQAYRIDVRPEHKAIVRSDDFSSLGVFKNGYNSASYGRMVNFFQESLQSSLQIWNAGELRNGGQFFMTVGMDETMHDNKSGLDFLPYVMFHSSLDGSLANTWVPGSLVTICDNMFAGQRAAARNAGRLVKFKRSRFSLSDERVKDLRSALAVMELEAEATTNLVHELVDIELSRPQWLKVLDIIIPEAKGEVSKAAVTKTSNRRQSVDAIYQNSPMVAPWTGTAFGAVQAFNTYHHHAQSVRGTSRVERVFDRAIRGDMAEQDNLTIAALEKVLQRELVTA